MTLLSQGDDRFAVSLLRRSPMGCLRAALVLLLLAQCWAATDGRAETAPTINPPSKWVVVRPYKKLQAEDAADPSQDYRWLLSDRQINAQSNAEFIHEVRQILSPAGIQHGSHVTVDYDPNFQSLTLHWARLWRGTNKLDRLDLSKLHVNQAGLDREPMLFSAQKTALLLLDDVRVGDVIDYAYTVEGTNSAWPGKFTGLVQLQFKQPVDHAVTRLIWPASRKLYLKNHLSDVQPTMLRKGNFVEYTWDVLHAAGLHYEPQTPVWYDPFPWVQLSEFQSWADVNRWALRLFINTNPPSPELTAKIKEWKQIPAPADRVLAALRFVQDEVRYVENQDGSAEYEPAPPSVVLARRFGDRKDKSLLFVAILRALKIEAFPVLVNDRRRQELAELQPSPSLFNYVIVQVNLDGQSFWLDTTATYERGPLTERFWPYYGWGLKVAPGATGLTPIPPCPVQPLTTVTAYLSIGGLNELSSLKIITVAEGPDAERLREHFAATPRDDIERDNLNAYSKLYPFISRAAPMVYEDNERQNVVETTEFYSIEKMWNKQQDEPYFNCRLYCVGMDDVLEKPAALFRTMPLGVPYPAHQIFHAEVNVVTAWPINPSNITIEDQAFYFQRLVNVADHKLLIDSEFRALTDAIAPDAVPGYVRDLNSATDALGYTIIGL